MAGSGVVGQTSLAIATGFHLGACWGGAGKDACDNAKVDLALLPAGYYGGKASETVAEKFIPGLRPFIIGAVDTAQGQITDAWKKLITGG